jgi:hypothetical protein
VLSQPNKPSKIETDEKKKFLEPDLPHVYNITKWTRKQGDQTLVRK